MSLAQKTISPRAWAELTLLALIWGASFLTTALILQDVSPMWLVAYRISGAAALLWIYILRLGISIPTAPRIWGAFFLMGLLNNALPFTLITWGQQHISSGLAAILNALTAVLGVLVAAILFSDERLSARKAWGVGLGFTGAAVIIGPAALTSLDLASLGQLALLGSSMSYALAGAWGRKTLSAQPPAMAATGMLTCAALIMIPMALWSEGAPSVPQSPQIWAALLYLSLIATAGAYLLYYRVLSMAGAGNLLLVTLMVAPCAIILGALVLDETLPLRAYAGFALLALGLIIIDGRLLRRNRV